MNMENNIIDVLDKLGYSKLLAQKRAKLYDNAGKGATIFERNNFGGDFNILIGGSRGDGTGVYLNCDVDKIFVQNGVSCVEKIIDTVNDTTGYHTVFELETDNVPKGYARLRLSSTVDTDENELQFNIKKSLETRNGQIYLRNDHTLCTAIGPTFRQETNGWLRKNINYSTLRTGPSEPYRIRIPLMSANIELDEVLAFRCSFPTMINQFCDRVSNCIWPSGALLETIKSQDIYVVPVGVKGHKDEALQWRICLNEAELTLVQSFNDSQIKVYAVMKMIAKHYLRPICDNITTYIIKNGLFWLIEKMPHYSWEREHIFDRTKDALVYMRTSVINEVLPNYMLPSRNMFENKLTLQQKEDLIKTIDSLLSDKAVAVANCTEINDLVNLDSDSRNQELKSRQAREETILAIFSFPPHSVANILEKLFQAQSESDFISIFSDDIFSYVRDNDPSGYFRHLRVMGNEEFYKTCNFPGCVLL